jgi:hypothetical protein
MSMLLSALLSSSQLYLGIWLCFCLCCCRMYPPAARISSGHCPRRDVTVRYGLQRHTEHTPRGKHIHVKTPINFVIPVCLRGSHETHFREICYWRLRKLSVENTKLFTVWQKRKIGQFTWVRLGCVIDCSSKQSISRRHWELNPLLMSLSTPNGCV